jgi:hypothetical protein
MDDSMRIAIALQVLHRRRGPLDVEAIAHVMRDRWPADVLMRALERAFGWVCGAESCNVFLAEVDAARADAARALLTREHMADLFEPAADAA